MIKLTLKPKRTQLLLADPTIISHVDSPDGKWHMFCHSSVGIQHYTSCDGEKWKEKVNVLLSAIGNEESRFEFGKYGVTPYSLFKIAQHGFKTKSGSLDTFLRAFVYRENDVFYLYYEKRWFNYVGNQVSTPDSAIYVIQSKDLYNWSDPQLLLSSSEKYELVASPSLMKVESGYRLFFTHGYILTGDSSLMEPAYLSSVDLDTPSGGIRDYYQYEVVDWSENGLDHVGALRCRTVNGTQILTCNTFDKSAIKSLSELHFAQLNDNRVKLKEVVVSPEEWKKSRIVNSYVADVIEMSDRVRVYFNVRKSFRSLDGYKVDKSLFGGIILILQVLLFSTEEIYYKDYSQEKEALRPL